MSTARASYQAAVDAYVAAGGDASVQRVITAIAQVSKKLDQWYDRQLADLGISHGDWSVLSQDATADGGPLTPSRLADAAGLAASSMTSRLDRVCRRGLVAGTPAPRTRTRVLGALTDPGWQLFAEAVRDADVVESDILAGLSLDERRELADLLEVVLIRLDHTG